MITSLSIKLYTLMVGMLTAGIGALRIRTAAPARGANFIEYGMLAVLAIVIGFVFRSQLGNAFDGMLGQIRSNLSNF